VASNAGNAEFPRTWPSSAQYPSLCVSQAAAAKLRIHGSRRHRKKTLHSRQTTVVTESPLAA